MHRIRPPLLERRVRIAVVGCGATGSAVLSGLPYLHQTLLAFGHPDGIHVTVIDGDTVSPANCVRQPFSESDIGLNKAVVLATRINTFWGLDWNAEPQYLEPGGPYLEADVIIGCVDTRRARRVISVKAAVSSVIYWLDFGNRETDGQVVLGEPLSRCNRDTRRRLPCVADLYPEAIDPERDDDALPSCSAAEALTRQAPFLNQVLANHGLSLLAQLFRAGQLAHHGVFVDPRSGRANPLRVPDVPELDARDWKEVRRLLKSGPNVWPRDVVLDAFDLQEDELRAVTGEP